VAPLAPRRVAGKQPCRITALPRLPNWPHLQSNITFGDVARGMGPYERAGASNHSNLTGIGKRHVISAG